jgi:hypothetical protein
VDKEMKTEPNDPAFPDPSRAAQQSSENQEPHKQPTGMTMRQYYAGLAMQANISKYGNANPADIAANSVLCADALIAELNKTPTTN